MYVLEINGGGVRKSLKRGATRGEMKAWTEKKEHEKKVMRGGIRPAFFKITVKFMANLETRFKGAKVDGDRGGRGIRALFQKRIAKKDK